MWTWMLQAISHEAMIVNDHVRMSLWAVPRVSSNSIEFHLPGRSWKVVPNFGILCWRYCAVCICGACAHSLALLPAFLCRFRTTGWEMHASPGLHSARRCFLLLLGNLSIYDEAIIWGLAWSLAATHFALRSRQADGAALTRSLLWFSLCAAGALLSRVTFGMPFVLIAPLLAMRIPRDNRITNFFVLLLPLGAALVFYVWLSYARFGSFTGVNFDYYVNLIHSEFAHKYGVLSPRRIPHSFADYFFQLALPRSRSSAAFHQRKPSFL